MDRWQAEMGRVREEKRREEKRREEKRRQEKRREEKKKRRRKKKEDQKRESLRRKKIQVRESRETQCFSGDLWIRRVEPASQMRDEKLHISKSKCTKHLSLGALLEVAMSKKCTPLWREAHFEVKMYKTPCSDHFLKLRCRKSACRFGAKHISKSKV